MRIFKEFFNYRETFIGVIIAFVFVLVFFCVWMTGYKGVTNRTDNLRIAIVNQDSGLGTTVKRSLEEKLPFKIKRTNNESKANQSMSNRNLDMIISIPKNFTHKIKNDQQPNINFKISQANASLAKSIMNTTATTVSGDVNNKIRSLRQKFVLAQISGQLEQHMPQKEVASKIANTLADSIDLANKEAVEANIIQHNKAKDFSITMIPLLVLLASFVGSMIMSLNLNSVSEKIRLQFSKWPIFFSRQLINLIMAVILALFTLFLMWCFGVPFRVPFIELTTFEFLVYFSFLCFTQMMLIVFGAAGMLLNILSLSIQLVTSGVLVPRVMLSSFYQSISGYFPASYISDGYMSVLFGGSNRLTADLLRLLGLTAIMFAISMVRVVFKKNKKVNDTISK